MFSIFTPPHLDFTTESILSLCAPSATTAPRSLRSHIPLVYIGLAPSSTYFRTINMSFQDYSAHCINAIDFEERLDLHLNGLYRDPSGIKHPIVVEMDLDSTTEPSLVFTQDIDAFIASNTRTLPVNDGIRCKVTLAPSHKSKMRLLEYGTYTIRNEVVNMKDIPHTMLCVVESYGLLKWYISFPGVYTANYIDSSSSGDETPTTMQYLFLSVW
ncbi:hypothetical protein INT48_003674 [Thamnidium elegans]|uniref:Uncharacterized protein n=1 Tax=Thamnidium elegans TaxID=101142 RepID=A0A8H7VQ99_9FUNG|nr:hypothetical protein INT48_003674 [Thamnidium elegans]